MSDIYVIGHKNPDTDSVCSAYCYAHLKNSIDKKNNYIPAVCGGINPQTKSIFEEAGTPPPVYIKDLYPKVSDIARNDGMILKVGEPILMAVKELDEHTISVIPVFNDDDVFSGIIGIHEIARYFIMGGIEERPDYEFIRDNFENVIPGHFFKKGSPERFNAQLMIGAMTYESSVARINKLLPNKPILIIGQRAEIINVAIKNNFPAIILTGVESDDDIYVDFSKYEGSVYISKKDTAETIRLLRLSVPVEHIMNKTPIFLQHDDVFDTAKKTLLQSDLRGLPVMKNNKYAGIVSRRSFIEKPKKKLILVDHNELSQSINGAEESDIREIIDHHRLAPEKTSTPIYVFSKPVGSTCTIIYQHYLMYNVEITREISLLLLSGIYSDTLFLKSPTTTVDDISAAEQLLKLSGIDGEQYKSRMLSKMPVLKNSNLSKLISSDFKVYNEYGYSLGISQIEVVSFDDLNEVKENIVNELIAVKRLKNINWVLLLITNVIDDNSVLIVTDFALAEEQLSYKKIENNLYDLPGILSRKKQLLPEVLRVAEIISKQK